MARCSVARTCAILLGLGLLLPLGVASPAQAVTCEEVRALTPAEVDYWAKRLKVSSQHLDTLLKAAFCEKRSVQPVIASTRKPDTDRAR
jgi:hypothetical protein